ncbi:MAG: hypothetical protein HOM69_10100 [Gammaproteobacteria bacterium]|jgi:hypothetical protein|nr:hypothetical protein [Gammaproteobacteria bacterium]MBT5053565.1 hypothetical protein [Gammaproteobacteria bacterium]
MLERYLGQIAVVVALLIGLAFWLMQSPEQAVIELNEAEAPPLASVRTRVDAVMTGCVRKGRTTRVEGLVRNLGTLGVTRVTVQSIWKRGDGSVVNTGLIYAVGEGQILAPGEDAMFFDTTDLRGVERCNVRALDWWSDE